MKTKKIGFNKKWKIAALSGLLMVLPFSFVYGYTSDQHVQHAMADEIEGLQCGLTGCTCYDCFNCYYYTPCTPCVITCMQYCIQQGDCDCPPNCFLACVVMQNLCEDPPCC